MESLTSQHYTVTMSNVQTGATFSFNQADLIMFQQALAFSAGVVAPVNIPGKGVAFLEAGTFRVDSDGNLIFQAGPFDYHDGDWQPVCALLSN